jgi:cytochrome c556
MESVPMTRKHALIASLFLLMPAAPLVAGDSPQEARHELMEDVGGAAKKIGKMMKGEAGFDAEVANAALQVWADAAKPFGDLFPEGSDTGFDTEAKATIWSDRGGFDEQLALFAEKADAAVLANPRDLDALKAAAGQVFKVCKSCHESYRIDD